MIGRWHSRCTLDHGKVLPNRLSPRTGGVMSASTRTNSRTMRKHKPMAQRGFSMMQLLVTLAVVSIVSGLAVLESRPRDNASV